MTAERIFLGWNAPALHLVRDYLIPDASEGPVDLRSTLVVVPTRHAGRRLRESLAVLCHDNNTYLLPPRIVTPPSLISTPDTDAVRQDLDVAAVWTRLLLSIDPADYPGLFPRPPAQTFAWALSTGRLLQSLRSELLEHGRTIRNVVDSQGDLLEERQRWNDMARLEDLYTARYQETTGESEPGRATLQAGLHPAPPQGIDRIAAACVADPAPLAVRALERLSAVVPTAILVHAPGGHEAHFDEWGRPLAPHWRTETIDIPDAGDSLILAGSPAAESAQTLAHVRRHGADIAVGILDAEVAPYLEAELKTAGLAAFDPNGVAVSTTPLLRLLHAYRDLAADGSYRSFANLLRNADMLDLLAVSGVRADRLLRELDECQNHYLPASASDIPQRFRNRAFTDELPEADLATLHGAIDTLSRFAFHSTRDPVETRLRAFLQSVFAHRELDYGNPDDDAFRATAELVDAALQASAAASPRGLGFSETEVLDLVLDQLDGARFVPQRARNAIDLEGWLELQWNDAQRVIVTGMNEGMAPARLANETFLSESLRDALGLRTNEDRYGRDIYLARALVESRRSGGQVVLVAAKTTSKGDPLKPSRLLFRCTDTELPERAARLFGPPMDTRSSVPSTVSFRLKADAPLESPPTVTHVSVTGLREYLACPFRFYLKNVLKMETLDDRKRELDALDFGSLVHDVMNAMAADGAMRHCDDVQRLREYLVDRADQWVARRLDLPLPVNIAIQVDAARERLAAAAAAHAREVEQGWRIVAHEETFECTLGGLAVRGRVDRVDRHIETGELRVLDYKTSEDPDAPEKAHLRKWRDTAQAYARCETGTTPRRWVDLQLPLYAYMAELHLEPAPRTVPGYFSLPNDPAGTGIVMWDGFSTELLESARACAEGAARDILRGRFWPPSEKVDFDNFESLFPTGTDATTIDPGCLALAAQPEDPE